MNPLDRPRIRRAMVASYAMIMLVVVLAAVQFSSGWSWWLFVWGAAFGPVAVVWAGWSNMFVARRIVASTGSDRELFERRRAEMSARSRITYLGILSFGLEAGVLSAALKHPGPDIALTIIWFVAGMLPPVVAYPFLLRKAQQAAERTKEGPGPSGRGPQTGE